MTMLSLQMKATLLDEVQRKAILDYVFQSMKFRSSFRLIDSIRTFVKLEKSSMTQDGPGRQKVALFVDALKHGDAHEQAIGNLLAKSIIVRVSSATFSSIIAYCYHS